MTHHVAVSHTFEAGHRLPELAGKCTSVHGHSWKVTVTVSAPEVDARTGIIVNFSALKAELRRWIDSTLDHGTMLGGADPLVPLLAPHGRIFLFDADPFPEYGFQKTWKETLRSDHTDGLLWPSVENVATLIARVMTAALPACDPVEGAYVALVEVSETPTNVATWEAPLPVGRVIEVGDLTLDAKLRVTAVEFPEP